MQTFLHFCQKVSPLDDDAALDFQDQLHTFACKKGDLLLKPGQVCNRFYFINNGLLKVSFRNEDDNKEFIMRFFPEGSICTQLESFLQTSPSTYRIVALENSETTFITKEDLDKLCQKYHQVETLFRKFISIAVVNMMKRVSEMLEENPAQRYSNFLNAHGDILQRISLGDLSSYLGISQVSLSRIRAR